MEPNWLNHPGPHYPRASTPPNPSGYGQKNRGGGVQARGRKTHQGMGHAIQDPPPHAARYRAAKAAKTGLRGGAGRDRNWRVQSSDRVGGRGNCLQILPKRPPTPLTERSTPVLPNLRLQFFRIFSKKAGFEKFRIPFLLWFQLFRHSFFEIFGLYFFLFLAYN